MRIQNLAQDAEDFTGNVWMLENDGEVALVDVGTGDSWNPIKELEKVDKVVVTHSHYDHVDNLSKVVEEFSPEVFAFEPGNLDVEARELDGGDEIQLCGTVFEVLHTPGHRDDSICLYSRENGTLFAGDLLFPDGGFGRTDLDQGDRDALIESIEKIAELDVDEMYCGHEPALKKEAAESIERSLENARKRESRY